MLDMIFTNERPESVYKINTSNPVESMLPFPWGGSSVYIAQRQSGRYVQIRQEERGVDTKTMQPDVGSPSLGSIYARNEYGTNRRAGVRSQGHGRELAKASGAKVSQFDCP